MLEEIESLKHALASVELARESAKEFECSLFASILAISQPGEKDDGESRP